jgi:hypothetical protein
VRLHPATVSALPPRPLFSPLTPSLCHRYSRAMQQFGASGAAAGFGVNSPSFVPSAGLGGVDGGGMLGDIDAGFKVQLALRVTCDV